MCIMEALYANNFLHTVITPRVCSCVPVVKQNFIQIIHRSGFIWVLSAYCTCCVSARSNCRADPCPPSPGCCLGPAAAGVGWWARCWGQPGLLSPLLAVPSAQAVVCLRSVPPSGLSRSLLLPRPGTCLHSGIVTQLLSGAGEHLSIVSSRQWWKKCTFWFTETASEGSCSIMLPVLGLISQLSNILHYENGYRAWPNTAAGWLCCCNS